MFKRAIISFFLLFLATSIFAQVLEFTENCRKAYIEISSLEFKKAVVLLKNEKKENPQNVLPVLFENYLEFLKVVIGEQEDAYDALRDKKRERIRAIKSADKESPYYLYAMANLSLHSAFSQMRFKDYFPAAFDIRRAYFLLEKNVEKYPDFLPNYIGMGLLHAMIGSIPDNYKWVSRLASMEGTVEQGYQELFMVLEKAQNNQQYSYLLNEAVFFLTFMEMNISANRKNAEKLLNLLNAESESDPLIVYSKISILRRIGRSEEGIRVLENFKQSETSYSFYYLTYLRGLLYLNRLDDSCEKYFNQYLKEYKGKAYIKASYQKLAWMALVKGDEQEYKRIIAFCLTEGNSHVDNDEQAEREAEREEIPNVDLLRARLLFDGGYYTRSIAILNDSVFAHSGFNTVQKTEYYYRLGRNYQELKDYDSAITYFEKAIEIGQNIKDYYAGNSALQLGSIYENTNRLDDAERYYQLCLDLRFKTYKRSLDVKAKAALSRIKTKKGAK